MKKTIIIILALLLILGIIVVFKTKTYPFYSAQPALNPIESESLRLDDSVLHRLSGGIRIPTVSTGELAEFDHEPFQDFRDYLQEVFPKVYSQLEYYSVNNNFGLVLKWKGKNPTLKPILFLSHMDVVPAGDAPIKNNDSTAVIFRPQDAVLPAVTDVPKEWTYPPFSGAVADGRIYGRGTLDMKSMLFSLFEAMTTLLNEDFTPQRDIYFVFGADEEVGGVRGAQKMAEDFKAKGLHFDAVYDEGGFIIAKGLVAGINDDLAVIGLAEKGFLSARIKVNGLGGHSSMPPLQTAIGKASVIMQRLENQQMKPIITPIMDDFLRNIGGNMPFTTRMAIANQWLLRPLLLQNLSKSNATNALIRTTTALTMMKGSDATNVLSPQVSFVVNFRLLPGDSLEDVKAHIAKACEGFDVEIDEIDNSREASSVSKTDSRAYTIMAQTIRKLYPDAIVTPYLTIAGTDAYKYEIVSDNVYRFMPMIINSSEQQTIHSTDEYVSIANYTRMIKYFESIMRNYDQE